MKTKGINIADLINHIIPAPPEKLNIASPEPIRSKVVNIPFAHRHDLEEIQSPIMKNRNKNKAK